MKKIFILLAFTALSYIGVAQTNVAWIRYPSISPDGTQIAFMYKGDIFTVGINGGRAVQLTTNPARNYRPVWSPDGNWIAFNSNRYGNMDVFIMPAQGGAPRRLTTHSGSERLQSFSHDGRYIYFTANIQRPASFASFPASWATQLYRVSVEGGRPFLVLPNVMDNVTISSDGSFLLYEDVRSITCPWRKHHTSVASRDVWRYDFGTREFTKLTTHVNANRNPVLSRDGQTMYFLSERNGSFNIFRAPTDREVEPTQITHHERHPVRFLSIADNGTLCYTFDGHLYVISPGGQPRRVRVDIFRDTEVMRTRFVTSGAREAVFSPNGREVAIIVEGNVYVTSTEFPTTVRITNTPGDNRALTWSPDGRSLAFSSERNGNWSIEVARNEAPYEPYFFGSNHIVTEFLVDDPNHQDFNPQFSPDGTEIAFVRDRGALMVLNLASGQIRQITDRNSNLDNVNYAWSPDGQWFTLSFIGALRHPILDIGLVSAAGGGEIINLTQCGYTQRSPVFAMNGNVILFTSDRFGMRAHASWGSQNDVFGIFTTQEAFDRFRMSREDIALDRSRQNLIDGTSNRNEADAATPEIDLRNIENRMRRLTIHSSDLSGFAMTNDGERLFYLARVERGFDLWMRDFRTDETRLLERLNVSSGSLRISNDGERLEVFAGGSIFTLNVRNTATRNNVTFRAQVDIDPHARREEMLGHVWRTIAERFYDENLHGADWDGFKRDYARFLPHINNYWCFAELLAEFAGELNASHASVRFSPTDQGSVTTARTGLFFDMTTPARGLRVEEVLTNGPFDNARSRVRPGHYLIAINGEEILENTDFLALLNGQVGVETTFTFRDGATEFTERNRPISGGAEEELLYQRWVQNQRDKVYELSNGRLGFVHIRGMNDASYRTIWSDMFGRFNEKEGIIVCVRNNGGGRMHEDVEALFTATKYLEHVARGQKLSRQPTRRWTRPSVMLQNEASYSNAHGTPWVYREMGLGTLIGAPVPGTMTTSGWVTLPVTGGAIRYGKPTAGWLDRHGNFLENQQLYPDIEVLNETNVLWQNRDQQLEEAVRVLLRKADEYVDPWAEFEHRRGDGARR